MKICPNCKTSYSDDNLQFCLQDGARLISDEPETIIRNHPMRIDMAQPQAEATPRFDTPFITNQAADQSAAPARSSNTCLVAGATAIAMLLIFGIGAGAFWYYVSKSEIAAANSNSSNGNTNTAANANAANGGNISNSPGLNSNWNSAANAATPAPATPKPTIKPAEATAIKKDVENVVYDWKEAAESLDLDANLNNYADTVDYYKGGKISRTKVKQSKQPAYDTYTDIYVEISNLKITPDPSGDKATAIFDKEWDFSGAGKVNRGQVQQQLVFTKVNGKWKITGEKDLKVYWTDKNDKKDVPFDGDGDNE